MAGRTDFRPAAAAAPSLACAARHSEGGAPDQRRKARLKALASE